MVFDGFTYGPWELSCWNCFLRTFVIRELLWHFNMAGIIGAAFAPMIAIWLATFNIV
jgi:hypothetical protein